MKFLQLVSLSISLAMIAAQNAAHAAEYPTKPVRMLVGFAPGGGTDTTARTIAQPSG